MGLYQPTVITPSSLNGTGVIDATQDMTISWYINGTIPIDGWRFVIMENTVESTVLYTSEWRHDYITVGDQQIAVYTYGRDGNGDLVPKTDKITAADLASAGIVNNFQNGYKLRIDQQYSVYENPNTSTIVTIKVLEQISPVFFAAMERASFSDNWLVLRGRYVISHFDLNNTSIRIPHTSFDPLLFGRFRLAYAGIPEEHVVVDTGNIYCPQNNTLRQYGILEKGRRYAARATGKLESGIEVDTGWNEFTPEWTDSALPYVHLNAYYVKSEPCICVRLEVDEGYDMSVVTSPAAHMGWEIYRIRVEDGHMEKAGVIPRGESTFFDYGARNNTEYKYRAYYGLGSEDGYCYETENPVKMRYYWNWAVIECEKKEARYLFIPSHYYTNVTYHVKRVFQFQGNIESGSVSNENKPNVQDNFTPYPTVQKSVRKGLTGTLKAWVGNVTNGIFTDSIKEIDRIMDLSTSESIKFLRDRKGNIRMIEISDAIKKATQDPYAEQPVEIELPWVEVGDASDAQIVSMLTDGYMTVGDDIYETATAIVSDPLDSIEWTWNDTDYVGSEINMDENGNLVQTYDDSLEYAPAALEIVDGELKVTTTIPQEDK